MLLRKSSEVFAAHIHREMAELAGNLCAQLLVSLETAVPRWRAVGCDVGVGHSSAAVQLQRHVKLPLLERRFV